MLREHVGVAHAAGVLHEGDDGLRRLRRPADRLEGGFRDDDGDVSQLGDGGEVADPRRTRRVVDADEPGGASRRRHEDTEP